MNSILCIRHRTAKRAAITWLLISLIELGLALTMHNPVLITLVLGTFAVQQSLLLVAAALFLKASTPFDYYSRNAVLETETSGLRARLMHMEAKEQVFSMCHRN